MKTSFPSDLLLLVLGPVFFFVIALGVGSVIFRAAQLDRFTFFLATAVFVAPVLFIALLLRRRRRRSDDA